MSLYDTIDKHPAVSWDGARPGETRRFLVIDFPHVAQLRDYDSGEPAFWENKDGSKSPKQGVVVTVRGENPVDEDDLFSLWAALPSAMSKAIQKALTEGNGGADPEIDSEYVVTFTGTKPTVGDRGQKLNDQKLYTVVYHKPGTFDASVYAFGQRVTSSKYNGPDDPPF